MNETHTIVSIEPIECGGHCEHGCKAEKAMLRAAAKSSKHAVWPPVPGGYGPPKSHLRKSTLTSAHPIAWVNEAMRPAYKRFAERPAPSKWELERFHEAEKEAQAEYALRLAKAEILAAIGADE